MSAPSFKRPGVPIFKVSGTPGHGALCCCHEEPAIPCTLCNASQTPNGMEVTITAAALEDWTCGGICTSLAGTYILDKVEDADCYYTYCEDDPCNGVSDLGDTYYLKIMAQIFAQDAVIVYMMFGTTLTSPVCSSVFNQIRMSSWTVGLGNPLTPFDCLDTIDYDLTADADDGSVDIGFCHAQGTVHARALN